MCLHYCTCITTSASSRHWLFLKDWYEPSRAPQLPRADLHSAFHSDPQLKFFTSFSKTSVVTLQFCHASPHVLHSSRSLSSALMFLRTHALTCCFLAIRWAELCGKASVNVASSYFIKCDPLTLTFALPTSPFWENQCNTCPFNIFDELDSFVYCGVLVFAVFRCLAEWCVSKAKLARKGTFNNCWHRMWSILKGGHKKQEKAECQEQKQLLMPSAFNFNKSSTAHKKKTHTNKIKTHGNALADT